MSNDLSHVEYRGGAGCRARRLRDALAASLVAVMLAAVSAVAAECPKMPPTHIPLSPPDPLNIDIVKDLLRDYHDRRDNNYDADLAATFAVAQAYVEGHAGEVTKPAVVLDIDETTLTNWPNILANNFGFIPNGRCDDLPDGPCGFNAWILKSSAEAIRPGLKFFNAVKSKGIPIFFITGRRDSQREATLWNLDRAGFEGWAKLVTRPDNDNNKSIVPFKSGERANIERDGGYTIIATIGDQQSDLAGGSAVCGFKLPNPFYFIP